MSVSLLFASSVFLSSHLCSPASFPSSDCLSSVLLSALFLIPVFLFLLLPLSFFSLMFSVFFSSFRLPLFRTFSRSFPHLCPPPFTSSVVFSSVPCPDPYISSFRLPSFHCPFEFFPSPLPSFLDSPLNLSSLLLQTPLLSSPFEFCPPFTLSVIFSHYSCPPASFPPSDSFPFPVASLGGQVN